MTRLVLWWFFVYIAAGYGGGPATVGPFETKEQCEQLRRYVREHHASERNISWCWWDGRPPR